MQRLHILLLTCVFLPAALVKADADSSVAYSKRWVQGLPAHVVTVNLNSRNVRVSPAIARYGIGTSEGFGSMLSRLQPTAAITGTYFCVRSLVPVGRIVIDSKVVNIGHVGTAVCIAPDNTVEFKPTSYASAPGSSIYPSILCTGPRLVSNGVANVAPWAEGFRDKALYRNAQRSALGVTKHNKLLLVTVNRPIHLSRLACVMRDLGAVNAVSLDGGSSTALFHKGRVLSHPGRRLTNLIVVYESPTMFARIKPQLAPSPVIAKTHSKS